MSFNFISRSREGNIEEAIFSNDGREIKVSFYASPRRLQSLQKFLKHFREARGKDVILGLRLKDNDDCLILNYSGLLNRFALEISGTESGIYFPDGDTKNILNWLRRINETNK